MLGKSVRFCFSSQKIGNQLLATQEPPSRTSSGLRRFGSGRLPDPFFLVLLVVASITGSANIQEGDRRHRETTSSQVHQPELGCHFRYKAPSRSAGSEACSGHRRWSSGERKHSRC